MSFLICVFNLGDISTPFDDCTYINDWFLALGLRIWGDVST